MLPTQRSLLVLAGGGANPDGLTTDQNGMPFSATDSAIRIGAVQTIS